MLFFLCDPVDSMPSYFFLCLSVTATVSRLWDVETSTRACCVLTKVSGTCLPYLFWISWCVCVGSLRRCCKKESPFLHCYVHQPRSNSFDKSVSCMSQGICISKTTSWLGRRITSVLSNWKNLPAIRRMFIIACDASGCASGRGQIVYKMVHSECHWLVIIGNYTSGVIVFFFYGPTVGKPINQLV